MTCPLAPSQTLYLRNIDDKISVNELKRELYCLFSFVAPVVEIEARKGVKTRGQAWISFANTETATIVMQKLQGFNFLGRELSIEYAKSRSKAIADYDEWLAGATSQAPVPEPEPAPVLESQVLTVTGFPARANAIVLGAIFRQVPGYQKTEVNGDTAFVYYATTEQAREALSKLHGFPVSPEFKLAITFTQ
jgi:hypothetical protein